jgi:hypothetical protein
MLDESLHGLVADGLWFHSDPDALLVRDFHSGFTAEEVQSLAMWQTMTGGNLCTSDPLHRCSADRQALWRFCTPAGVSGAARIPRYATGPDERIVVRELGDGRTAVLAFNTGEAPKHIHLPVADCASVSEAWIHPWGPGPTGDPWHGRHIQVELAPHQARLYLISGRRLECLPATLAG